jgi:hypothetical protein
LCACVLLSSCAGEPAVPPPSTPSPFVCALPRTDDDVAYDAWFASVDVVASDTTIATDLLDALTKDTIAWMIDVPRGDALVVSDTLLGRAVTAAMTAGTDDERLLRLQQGIARLDACQKKHPPTLQEFRDMVDAFDVGAGETITSMVKPAGTRTVVRDADVGAFVSVTDDDTEIILSDRRRDGALEFLRYASDGTLSRTTTFAVLSPDAQAVPVVCMQCHRAPSGGFVDVSPRFPR